MDDDYGAQIQQQQQQQAAYQAEQQRSYDAQAAEQQRDADASRAFNEREQQNQQFFNQQAEAEQRRQSDDYYAQQQYASQLQDEQDRLGRDRLNEEELRQRWDLLNQSRMQANGQGFDQSLFQPQASQWNQTGQPWNGSSSGGFQANPIDLTLYAPKDLPASASAAPPKRSALKTLSGIVLGLVRMIGFVVFLAAVFLCFTATSTNDTYVFGKPINLKVNGHLHSAETMDASQLVNLSLYGRIRSLIRVPQKFELTKSVVIRGSISNVELVGPGEIKIIGDVDDCTLITPHGFVSVVGSVLNHSVIDANDLTVTGSVSSDSSISR